MSIIKKTNKIQVICPICKKRDLVGIPRSQLNKNSSLNTISIQKGLICPHHFQFFLDNHFQIRGYQKVDLELNQENSKKLSNGVKALSLYEGEEDDLFENVTYDGNQVKLVSLNSEKINKKRVVSQKINSNNKHMTLKEIYQEFWELIDNDNIQFHKFIINDLRRKDLITKYQTVSARDHSIYQSI